MSHAKTTQADPALRVALVIPSGESEQGFFPDGHIEHMCWRLIQAGHDARLLRVYYDGRSEALDHQVRAELTSWLEAFSPQLVVAERMFDPTPFQAYRQAKPTSRLALVSWGDAELVDGVDFLLGFAPGKTRGGNTRRSPSAGELAGALDQLVHALATHAEPKDIAGLAQMVAGKLELGPQARQLPLPSPFRAVLKHEVISAGSAPLLTRKYLFGNAGCPYAADPQRNPFYRNLLLPTAETVSVLGCAFCRAGGDYQKQPELEVVESLLEQAEFYVNSLPGLEELVLVDQYPVRYLAQLLEGAQARGIPGVRWLFQARADAFTRDVQHVRAAVQAAERCGYRVEVFLTGFESFSDRELQRYNKGVSALDLQRAVDEMRRLNRELPQVFSYARAKGHSMIMWSPWTTPEDLQDNVQAIRAGGLMELFDEVGRNRCRLYPDLPLYYAAEGDGLLQDSWDDGDAGAGRLKGYGVERPWRFQDTRTRTAYSLTTWLREELGRETEIDQIAAVANHVEGLDPHQNIPTAQLQRPLEAGVGQLRAALDALLGARQPTAPASSSNTRCVPLVLSGGCNNGCQACPNRDTWRDSSLTATLARLSGAAAEVPIMIAGREPTLFQALPELIQATQALGPRGVGLVTNARRCAISGYARSLAQSGLSAASVKLFAPSEGDADAITRDAGAFRQTLRGIRELTQLDVAVELRVPLHKRNLHQLARYAQLASSLGLTSLRVEASLEAVGLEGCALAAAALRSLGQACKERQLSLDANPLSIGTRGFDRIARIEPRAMLPSARAEPPRADP